MANLRYDINSWQWGENGECYTSIPYSVSYDPIKNQSTVKFSTLTGRIWGSGGTTTIATTTLTVTATDSGNKASANAETSAYLSNMGYKVVYPAPSPASVIVKHSNTAGEKKVKISGSTAISFYWNGDNGNVTKSGSVTVTTGEYYPASSLTVANGTLGTSQTLQVSKNVDSFKHTITYVCGAASGTICSKSSDTEIAWTPTLSLASQNTSGASVAITLTITTYDGDNALGSKSVQIVCAIPESVKPSLTLTVNDATGAKDRYGAYVKGLSMFDIVATAETAYGSPIAAYKITANGGTYTAAEIRTHTE